jgi:uncharacterized membrane protein YfcA
MKRSWGGSIGGSILFEVSADLALILVCAAFLAGFVDAIAGGGGLITVPVLLLCGLTPAQALATNKLQGCFGSGTAALTYGRSGHVNLASQWQMALVALVASGLGALIALALPADMLRNVMPFILIAVALYFWLRPGLTDAARVRRLAPVAFGATFVPLVAIYDGFFGPGAGSFYMLGFVLLAGHGLLQATAHTKLLNFASNFGSLMVFAIGGHILWAIGLTMALAQVAGANLGARVAMRIGARLIRPLLIVVCLALAARLLWQTYG